MSESVRSKLGFVLVFLAGASWGSIGLFNRMTAQHGLSLMNRIAIRNIGGFLLMTLLMVLFHRKVFRVRWKSLPCFAAMGIVSILLLAYFYFQCQQECSLAVSATLLYLAPTLVILLGRVLWKQRITKARWLSMALTVIGCALTGGILSGGTSASLRGILLGLAAAVCYSTYTILSFYVSGSYDSLTIVYWSFFFASLGSLFFLRPSEITVGMINGEFLFGLIGLTIFGMTLPYILYTLGLALAKTSAAAIMANSEPVMAAVLGVTVFHEALTAPIVLGILLALAGCVISTRGE